MRVQWGWGWGFAISELTHIHEVHHGQQELSEVHVAHLLRVVEGVQILPTKKELCMLLNYCRGMYACKYVCMYVCM